MPAKRGSSRSSTREILPVPPEAFDFDSKSLGKPRGGINPLKTTQPNGASFKVNGQEIKWQNWRFRFMMHPREGLVLYRVEYNDKGKWRSVIYRASLAEMMVPYGHVNPHWTYQQCV